MADDIMGWIKMDMRGQTKFEWIPYNSEIKCALADIRSSKTDGITKWKMEG
jgi:hypothetical protein